MLNFKNIKLGGGSGFYWIYVFLNLVLFAFGYVVIQKILHIQHYSESINKLLLTTTQLNSISQKHFLHDLHDTVYFKNYNTKNVSEYERLTSVLNNNVSEILDSKMSYKYMLDDDIKKLLSDILVYNQNNKKNIGYGYVAFVDPEIGRYMLEEVKSVSIDGKKVELRRFVEKNLTDSSDSRVEEPKPKEPKEKEKGTKALPSKASFDAFIWKEDGHDCTTPGSASATDVHNTQDIHCTKPTNKRYFQYDRSFSRTRASDAANLAFRVLKPQSTKRSYKQQRKQVNKSPTYSPYFLEQPVTF